MKGLNYQEEEFKKNWQKLSAFITPYEKKLIAMRLGFFDGTEHGLRKIGEKFLISRERVRQIIFDAYQRANYRSKTHINSD